METKVKIEKQRREEGILDKLRVAYETDEYITYHDVERGIFFKQYKLPFGAKEVDK